MIKVSIIFGTRPEVIKLARIINAFEGIDRVQLSVCFTGQHKEMVLPLLDFFEIEVDSSLEIMQPGQTLNGLASRSLLAVDEYLQKIEPDIVFVQGDTTTAMCAATAAFHRKIKIAHVEAGLRTHNIFSPFPEEFNRQVISKIADIHFAPTESAKKNLLDENIPSSKIFVTGNPVIDTLLFTRNKMEKNPAIVNNNHPWEKDKKKFILITGHRRENFGSGFENICAAVKELAEKYSAYNFVFPVHLNPNVQEPVNRVLSGTSNIFLIEPVQYIQFTSLMDKCHFILTDSGGVQEEAPTFGKPVLVLRKVTERPEASMMGLARIVGTSRERIVEEAANLLTNQALYRSMSEAESPYGDGRASERISKALTRWFQGSLPALQEEEQFSYAPRLVSMAA